MKDVSNKTKLSRRAFVVCTTAVAGGGLALGFHMPADAATARAASVNEGVEVNAWVVVKPDDTCVIRIARTEMGQGTRTGLAQLVAEELECDWKKVTTDSVTPGQNLTRKRVWGEMGTGGSRGIRTSHDYVRRGGAAARMMLVQAAADRWNVPAGELTVSDGVISHAGSKRSISYGKVAAAAAKLPPVAALKIEQSRVVGQPSPQGQRNSKLYHVKVEIDASVAGQTSTYVFNCIRDGQLTIVQPVGMR